MTKTIFDKRNNKYASCVVNKQNWNRFDRNGIDASKIRCWKVIALLKPPDKRDWLLQSREVNCVGSKYNYIYKHRITLRCRRIKVRSVQRGISVYLIKRFIKILQLSSRLARCNVLFDIKDNPLFKFYPTSWMTFHHSHPKRDYLRYDLLNKGISEIFFIHN